MNMLEIDHVEQKKILSNMTQRMIFLSFNKKFIKYTHKFLYY